MASEGMEMFPTIRDNSKRHRNKLEEALVVKSEII
jgi:hypothetical protein